MTSKARADLSDVTFVIPVRIDSNDRRNNLELVVDYLNHNVVCDIAVGEMSKEPEMAHLSDRCRYTFFQDDGPNMHKTRLLNLLVHDTNRPIVAIYDADVLCDVEQYQLSVEMLRDGEASFVYPYDGTVLDVERTHLDRLRRELSVQFLAELDHNVRQEEAHGGATFFLRKAFIEFGMMNETFRSWGLEDTELLLRIVKLGAEPACTSGPIFHLDHQRGPDSSAENPFIEANRAEYLKVRTMGEAELRAYIASWEWCRPR